MKIKCERCGKPVTFFTSYNYHDKITDEHKTYCSDCGDVVVALSDTIEGINETLKKNDKVSELLKRFVEKHPNTKPKGEVEKLHNLLRNKYNISIDIEILEDILYNFNKSNDNQQIRIQKNENDTRPSWEKFEQELLSYDRINELKDKINKWKKEGYDVSELEKMIVEANE